MRDYSALLGKIVTVHYRVGNPSWATTAEGRIVLVDDRTLTLRDTKKTMGQHARTVVSLAKIDSVEVKQ